MSITFSKAGDRPNWDDMNDVDDFLNRRALNVHNNNANELLAWLELPRDGVGALPARDLAARARRRLWPEARNIDPGEEGEEGGGPGTGMARFYSLGRPVGRLEELTRRILEVAELAGEALVEWS